MSTGKYKMNTYLFTVGLGVTDRPERWSAICGIYAKLAHGLAKLGHRVLFLVNPKAFDAPALCEFDVVCGDYSELVEVVQKLRPNVAFIWGGRTEPDRRTAKILAEYNIRTVFSELGWFPQKGTIYFDANGTNSQMSTQQLRKMAGWKRSIFKIKRTRACQKIYGRSFHFAQKNQLAKRVFVPLQDELDTNITIDSPFARMNDLLKFLSDQYPSCEFVARNHPKASLSYINPLPNVTMQQTKENLYDTLQDFDLVVGINSTVISEAVFLGHPAMCFGNGIARNYGLAEYINPKEPPPFLYQKAESPETLNALNFLYMHKQLQQSNLSSPAYLQRSYLKRLLNI